VAAQRRVAAAEDLDPRAQPSCDGDQAASGQRGALYCGWLGQATRIAQHETDRGRVERGVAGALVQNRHHLDAMHRLRPGRVIVKHSQQQSVRGTHLADRLPEAIIVRDGVG
jgi:hypothetical protein